MRQIFLSAILLLSTAGPAWAKTPPDVLKPYKAYKTALENDNKDKALKHARTAWETAETLIGDSPTTGNLAQNYADLQRYQDFDEAIRGYKRAVALATEDTEDNKSIKLERLIKLSEMYIATPEFKKARKYVDEAESLIKKTSLQNSTFDGEIKVLSGWLEGSVRGGNRNKAISDFDAAIEIFKSPSQFYDSVFPYLVHIYKGDVLNSMRKPIEAALEYQIIMQNLEGTLLEDHPFVKRAFFKWLAMREVINERNLTERALKAGVCECWPYDEITSNMSIPLTRVAPQAHSNMRKSGQVVFKYDIDETGSPINLKVVEATDKIFIRPSRIALKKWKYEPLTQGQSLESRRGLVSTMKFNIYDGLTGKIIRKPKSDN